jgi:hypothetical protein
MSLPHKQFLGAHFSLIHQSACIQSRPCPVVRIHDTAQLQPTCSFLKILTKKCDAQLIYNDVPAVQKRVWKWRAAYRTQGWHSAHSKCHLTSHVMSGAQHLVDVKLYCDAHVLCWMFSTTSTGTCLKFKRQNTSQITLVVENMTMVSDIDELLERIREI